MRRLESMLVLILVVVDDGLVLRRLESMLRLLPVLILVVVDDGLVRVNLRVQNVRTFAVLILVVVDDGLVPSDGVSYHTRLNSLNPCCSGRWSRTYH